MRTVWITLHHLCLSTHCLDSLLGRSGESRSLHGNLLGNSAVTQNLVTVLALVQDTLSQQSFCGDDLAILKLVEGAQVDDFQGLSKNVVEAALGDTACQRHLAAFKSVLLCAAAGFLTLITFCGGLADALANGGFFGQGYLNGDLTQLGKRGVPEGHNDFIFVCIGEELGFLGCLVVLILLTAICIRCLRVAALSVKQEGKFIAIGIFAMLFDKVHHCDWGIVQ